MARVLATKDTDLTAFVSCTRCGGLAVGTPVLEPINAIDNIDGTTTALCDVAAMRAVDLAQYGVPPAFYCQDCDGLTAVAPYNSPLMKAKREAG